jgi:hypothetical protein
MYTEMLNVYKLLHSFVFSVDSWTFVIQFCNTYIMSEQYGWG